MKIIYRKITQEEQDRIKLIIDRVVDKSPSWVNMLTISVNGCIPADASMTCVTDKPYGRMTFNLNDGIIDSWTDEELFNDFMHEMAHGFNDEIRNIVDNILPKYVSEDHLEYVKDQCVRAIETDTESLAVQFRRSNYYKI